MRPGLWRSAVAVSIFSFLICCGALLMRSSASPGQEKAAASKKPAAVANPAEAYRFNTLGVAYMNQQRPADAQKFFEQALEADPKFAVARLNLGVSLMGQQKLEPARATLEEAKIWERRRKASQLFSAWWKSPMRQTPTIFSGT